MVFWDLKHGLTSSAWFYSKTYNHKFHVFRISSSSFRFCLNKSLILMNKIWVNTNGLIQNMHIHFIIIIIIWKQTSFTSEWYLTNNKDYKWTRLNSLMLRSLSLRRIILEDDLARLLCKAYQLLINEILNLVFKNITSLCKMSHVSNMVPTCVVRIMLRTVGRPSRPNLLGHNFPSMNQDRKYMRVRHWNQIIARMSPYLTVVPSIDLILVPFLIALSGLLIWYVIMLLGIKWNNACNCIVDFTRFQFFINLLILHKLIWEVCCHVVHDHFSHALDVI